MKNQSFKSIMLAGAALALTASSSWAAAELVGKPEKFGSEPRVDSPVDARLTAHAGKAGTPVSREYRKGLEMLDATDAKRGTFSVVFDVQKKKLESAFGFSTGPYFSRWELSKDGVLTFQAKCKSGAQNAAWTLALYDTDGRRAFAPLAKMAGENQWRSFTMPLSELKAVEGFRFDAVAAIQLEAELPEGSRVWIDDMLYTKGDATFGISDKTITQYMAEAHATRPLRVEEARMKNPFYSGKDLDKANQAAIEDAEKVLAMGEAKATTHDFLFLGPRYNEMLFGYSSFGRIKPNRLSKEAEEKVLAAYWRNTQFQNDIAIAGLSTWWVGCSENMDISMKMKALLTSQIFMHLPGYKDRVYPDLGRMIAYGFGSQFENVPDPAKCPMRLGSGNYKDGKEYRAPEHYAAWVSFWKEYLRERAKYGFFIETNARTYMSHTQDFLHEIYAWSEDEELRQQARMFLDLAWAQWAQDQILMFTCGSVVRGFPTYSRMGIMAEKLLGAPFDGYGSFYADSDYELPREVWEMILGRSSMSDYAYISHKTNEDEDIWPRPPGTEGNMLINRLSRMQRYSWVTPAYVIGSRMDHPTAIYTQLFNSREGIIFPTENDAAIYWEVPQALTVQDKGVLLTTKKPTYIQRTPPWIGEVGKMTGRVAVSFGQGLDQLVEKDGWIFAQEGNAFAACRIVIPEQQEEADSEQSEETAPDEKKKAKKPKAEQPKAFAFDKDGSALLHPDPKGWKWAEEGDVHWKLDHGGKVMVALADIAAVVVEASDRSHHPSLEAFMKDVLDNRLVIKPGNGSFIVEYTGCGKDAPTLALTCGSLDIPTVGGKRVNYECPTFQSPWLEGATGSGDVTLTGPLSGNKLVLDFNKIERRKSP